MKISRENIEAYFLDYYEGRLSAGQVAELMLFLDENPGLKEAFESYEAVELEPENIFLENKDALKKELDIINLNNYQEYIVAELDNELSPGEKKELENFLEKHPELTRERELFRKTIFSPDPTVKFDKDSLRKADEISAANYEEFFIASAEKMLDRKAEEAVQRFIGNNVSLRKEYEQFQKTILRVPQGIIYENKQSLKRYPARRRVLYYYVSLAAGLALLLGIYFFQRQVPDAHIKPVVSLNEQPLNSMPDVLSDNAPGAVAANPETATESSVAPVKKTVRTAERESGALLAFQPRKAELETITPAGIKRGITEVPESYYIVYPFDLHVSNTGTLAMEEEYVPVKDAILKKIKTRLYGRELPQGTENRVTVWDLAYAGAKGLSALTGKEINMKATYTGGGKVQSYQVSAGNFEFSHGR